MIVDVILDRKDGIPYNPREFYYDMMAYGDVDISRAMDFGTEKDVKDALKRYIDDNEYNPQIKKYIESVDWLKKDGKKNEI